MFGKLDMFRLSSGLAQHASARQGEIARNVANADTPGYRARDTVSFEDAFRAAQMGGGQKATRAGHSQSGLENGLVINTVDAPSGVSPNGNTVSLESEMMKSSQARHDHELALSVYRSSMSILRASIGRR